MMLWLNGQRVVICRNIFDFICIEWGDVFMSKEFVGKYWLVLIALMVVVILVSFKFFDRSKEEVDAFMGNEDLTPAAMVSTEEGFIPKEQAQDILLRLPEVEEFVQSGGLLRVVDDETNASYWVIQLVWSEDQPRPEAWYTVGKKTGLIGVGRFLDE